MPTARYHQEGRGERGRLGRVLECPEPHGAEEEVPKNPS